MTTKAFTGGDKLQAVLADIAAKVTRSATLNVGFLEGATYPNGTPVAEVAAIQEFGAPSQNIPPRPFFRDMIAKDSPGWGNAVGHLLATHDYDATQALTMMGDGIKGQLQKAIIDFQGAPLSEATIARKGNSNQLVDTGHMLNSVDREVVE